MSQTTTDQLREIAHKLFISGRKFYTPEEYTEIDKALTRLTAILAAERLDELFLYFNKTVGDRRTPIRSKYVAVADEYLRNRNEELKQLKKQAEA